MEKKKRKPKKKNPPEVTGEGELIIIGEPPGAPLTGLPETGETGVWYFFNGEYWFYNPGPGEWISGGGDRPTKPPVIP